jgi:Arc/MetJ-type ribon-helix-helix transcriptional regulator
MSIMLTPEQAAFINQQVASGRFASPEEVLDVALHLFQIEVHTDPLPLEELRQEIALGDAEFERSEYTTFDSAALKTRLEQIKTEGRQGRDMPQDNLTTLDLYGVHAQREELRRKTERPYFADWWRDFLAQREAALIQPVYPDIPAWETMEARARWEAGHKRLTPASSAMHALSFGYAMTGDRRFAERARDIALHIAEDDTDWMSPGAKDIYPELRADLVFATLCIEMSVSLGWIGETLSVQEKSKLLDLLAAKGAVIYADSLRGAWWGDALNSNWTSHLMHGLGAAGLALLHAQPETARPWVEMATDRMRRMLDLAREEGAGIEGIGYFTFCYYSILRYGTELRTVTGEDLLTHEFWGRCALFPLYHTLPDLSGRTPTGDSAYPGLNGSVLLSGVAREARDGIAQWQTHRILEAAKPGQLEIYDLLYYDPTVAETPPDSLPPCRVFHSVQLASFRSGWDKDAVYLLFHGGSNTWSHCHLDLNAFTLDAYGERLAIDHGSWGYTPHYFRVVEPQISTAWHNTLVVDGADQRQAPRFRMTYDATEGGDCYALLEDHLSCAGFEMIRGDATSAYADMLDRFWREIVYLRPDRFVLFDNVRTNEARVQRHLQWLLHSDKPMAQIGERIEVQGEKARLIVQPLFPTGWRCRFPDRLGYAHAHGDTHLRTATCMSVYPEWIHIWNESPGKSPYPHWEARGDKRLYGPDYPYLVVLTPVRKEMEIGWQVEALQADGIEGVRIAEGANTDTVLFKRFGGPYAVGTVESDAEKVVIREAAGRVTSAALVRGTTLRYRGQTLLSEARPVSRAWDL